MQYTIGHIKIRDRTYFYHFFEVFSLKKEMGPFENVLNLRE